MIDSTTTLVSNIKDSGIRFKLSSTNERILREQNFKFGFPESRFGEIVYRRTYSRTKEDGSQENWYDTVIRVIKGLFTIRKWWFALHNLPWNEEEIQKKCLSMAISMLQMKWLPPGRGLFAMGTDYLYERGSACLFNCSYIIIRDLVEDVGWLMDFLMCGSGVSLGISENPQILYPVKPYYKSTFVVLDSREGWIESVQKLLESYLDSNEKGITWTFDYSKIRKYGEPLKGFGGQASGPDPLILLHSRLRKFCEDYIEEKINWTHLCANICNAIGACVVAGNLRRSAELIVGSAMDDSFLDLKNYLKYPERMPFGWLSNNAVRLKTRNDFLKIPEIAKRIRENGEPSIFNLLNAQKYARYGDESYGPDAGDGLNPCQPGFATVLTPEGIKTFDDVEIGSTIWSGKNWTKISNKKRTGIKPVYEYETRAGSFIGTENHRVLSNGERVEAQNAEVIDVSQGCSDNYKGYCYNVETTIHYTELDKTYKRDIPDRIFYGNEKVTKSFLRGIFSANGSIVRNRVTLKASSLTIIKKVQQMLSSLGILSYYTINKSHDVIFGNGEYTCRTSYDLNITRDRKLFATLIGFIHPDKINRLEEVCEVSLGQKRYKTSYEVKSLTYLGDLQVFDITVENEEHTYWTGGLLVSNCAEIILEGGTGGGGEVCNLSEVFPSRCSNRKEFLQAVSDATFYASTVSLYPTHSPKTNAILARNRRIGVSLTGIAEWIDTWGYARCTRWMKDGYKVVREENASANREAGVPPSIRVSCIKPSGSVSQLAGVSSGMHHPIYNYAIRRIIMDKENSLTKELITANYSWEPSLEMLTEEEAGDREYFEKYESFRPSKSIYPYKSLTSIVIECPIEQGKARPSSEVSAWEQFSTLAMLQREWADNSVSATISYDPETEGHQLEQMLTNFVPVIKSVSMLPRKEGIYPQMPYEEITEEDYNKRIKQLDEINWSKIVGGDASGVETLYCESDRCNINLEDF